MAHRATFNEISWVAVYLSVKYPGQTSGGYPPKCVSMKWSTKQTTADFSLHVFVHAAPRSFFFFFLFINAPLFQPADSLYESPTKQRPGVIHAAGHELRLRSNLFSARLLSESVVVRNVTTQKPAAYLGVVTAASQLSLRVSSSVKR